MPKTKQSGYWRRKGLGTEKKIANDLNISDDLYEQSHAASKAGEPDEAYRREGKKYFDKAMGRARASYGDDRSGNWPDMTHIKARVAQTMHNEERREKIKDHLTKSQKYR